VKKILFVVNNLSGTVLQYNIKKIIELNLDPETFDHDIFYIDHNTASKEYDALFEKNYEVIVSVGGDGTLLEIGQQIIDKPTMLGIVPIGSGNGLATHLGYVPRDIDAAFAAINKMKTLEIDVAKLNNDYFFSNFGYGLDAKIAKDFKVKKKRNLFVYTWLTMRHLFNLKTRKIRYAVAGKEYTVKTILFNVFNSNLFGYNVGLIPWASAFDGKLDLVYLEKFPIWKMPYISFCILIKKPNWVKEMHYHTIDEIYIYNDKEKINYQIDGDPKRTNEDISIKVLPKKLKVIVP
jgi:YegS/Rv2252/BmrU family lipid kinase